jgi:nicotinamidase-related amidase
MELNQTALLIVDVQTAIVKDQPYKIQEMLQNINRLLTYFRNHSAEIIYVRHDGGEGDDLQKGTAAWQIQSDIAPAAGEKIFDKNYNSAFRRTGLREYLEQKEIRTLVLTGLQTEYCIDATCKVAFEYGFEVIVPDGTVSTLDSRFLSAEQLNEFYVYHMWNNRYAKVIAVDDIIGEK